MQKPLAMILRSIRGLGALFILTLLLSPSALALAQGKNSDDLKRILKQAGKVTRKGDLEEGERLYKLILASQPEHTRARIELSMIYLKQRRVGEAYDLVFPIVEKDEKNADAFAVLGAALLTSGRFREARLLLVNAIKLDGDTAFAWASLGMLDFYENRLEESLLNLREAVFRDPREPDHLFNLGQVATRAEQYKEAADAYRKFLLYSRSTDKDRRERIKGVINFLDYLGARRSLFTRAGEDSTTVPVRLHQNRPFIEVRVNGKDEVQQFVLDTGSGISVISEETAERLGINVVTRGGFAQGIGGDGKFEIVYGFVDEIRIGGVEIRNVPVYIRRFHHEDVRIDGYIGLSLVSKYITTIDYGAMTFSLEKPNDSSAAAAENPAAGVTLPLRLTSSGFLSGEVKLNGVERPLNFILDTGASITVISKRLSQHAVVSEMVTGDTMRVIGSAGVTHGVSEFVIPEVSFGPLAEKELRAIALDLNLINDSAGFDQAGILGGNFLNKYRITFDFKNSKVIFFRTGSSSGDHGVVQ